MERRLIILAALAAAGKYADIPEAAAAAAAAGAPPAAIRETLVFLVPYCGWPTALNALLAVAADPASPPVTDGEGGLDSADRVTRRGLGLATARRVNNGFDRVTDRLAQIDPALVDHLAESAYGYIYNRPGLDLSERELLAVAILAVQSHHRQLLYHLQGARNVGASDTDIDGVIDALGEVDGNAAERARRAFRDILPSLDR